MPIINGKYQNPGWVDNAPPLISAQNLNDISSTLERLDKGSGSVSRVTLAVSGWSGGKQTVTVPGVAANQAKQMIHVTPDTASQTAYYDSQILCTAQGNNTLTFTAAAVPAVSLEVYVVVQGVS